MRYFNPWTYQGPKRPSHRFVACVGWATDYPDGHRAIDTVAAARQETTYEGIARLPRTVWVVTRAILCECGARIADVRRRGTDPRRDLTWPDMLHVETLHGDHCRHHTGRRPRTMMLQGPIQSTRHNHLAAPLR